MNMLPIADEAEQIAWDQTWRNVLWIPPSSDEPVERAMLHLDDEMAGLIEAADTPADGHAAHSTRPEASSSVPGNSSLVHSEVTVLSKLCWVMLCCAMS